MRKIIEEILDGVLKHLKNNCPRDITDLVFLEIEKNHMDRYNHLVKVKTKHMLNKNIGKYIKEYWSLINIGICNSPKSHLINSYTEHSNHN
jgi:hypothetical protein